MTELRARKWRRIVDVGRATMRTTFAKFAVLAAAAGAVGLVWADEHPREHPTAAAMPAAAPGATPAATAPTGPQTVRGEIVDMACFLPHAASGQKHAACAAKCIKGGAPAGLLKADGSVLWLTDDHEKDKGGKTWKKVAELAGKQVKVTGAMAERGGAKALLVETIEEAK